MSTAPAPLRDTETPPRQPWFKFFPSDWQGDELLAMCSIGARGLLIELVCLMHRTGGYLLINGKAPTDVELARATRAGSAVKARKLLTELLARGVLSTTDKGVVYSRRIVRKVAQSAVGRETGRRGGNPRLKLATQTVNGAPYPQPLTSGDNTQKLEARNQTPKPPSVLTDDALAARAGSFLRRYPDIYARCRSGAHYGPKEARDFPSALDLVSAHPNDDRLDSLLEVFLRMPPDAARGMNHPGTVNQFAHLAPDCDRVLREHGR